MTVSHEIKSNSADSSLAAHALLQNRYRVVRQLGRGGMGAVYEAVDERLGITVALKETLSAEAPMRKQFEQEARLLASMQHPALPRVSDHFVEGHRAFLVMQFIAGVDLAKIIAQQPGPFPRDQVIAWADQLLDALIYLHSRDRQVIHRDIKPHNLKLTATGQIALLDFGLARAQPADQSLTASQAFFGYTKHYAPLEQIQDQRTDPRSDIYALGATLYHLLTGIKPPDAMVRATALINSETDPLQPANRIHPAVGPQIAAILSKAMAQRSEDRFSSASEFREALRCMGRMKEIEIGEGMPTRLKAASAEKKPVTKQPLGVELKMQMVASDRRVGPGAMTVAIILIATLASGLLYASQNWSWFSGQLPSAPVTNAASLERQSLRKSDKPRNNEGVATSLTKTRAQSDVGKPDYFKRNHTSDKPASIPKRTPVTPANSPTPKTPSRKGNRPDAPSIRLPKPEVAENARLISADTGSRNYGTSIGAPRFFRAADGTQTVRFSDGTTRTIRPGERSGH